MYWDKMLIMQTGKKYDDSNLIISENRPSFFAMTNFSKTFKSAFSKFQLMCLNEKTLKLDGKILQEISDFYTKHNLMLSGNMNRVKITDLTKYINLDAELIIIKKDEKILGSILSLPLPIHIETDLKINDNIAKGKRYENIIPVNADHKIFFVGHTTFLNNHKKYRGKGLGMILIQKSLQVAYDIGVLISYFLNRQARCSNAIKIRNWIFPVNPDRLDILNISYPRKYRSSYIFNLADAHTIIAIDENNSEKAFSLYLKLVSPKKFYLCPDLKYWKKWIENHKTYMLKIKDNCVGIFTINKITSYIPSKKCEIQHGNVLICVGQQPETLKSLIYTARLDNYDMITLQECGDLNSYLLTKIMAINTGTHDYLNFYNTKLVLHASDIYAPLI